MTASPSPSSLPKKLGLAVDAVFTVRRPPAGFAERLVADDLGDAIWQQSLMAPLDLILAFHTHRAQLVAEWPRLTEPLHPDGAIWIASPKPTSGVATDLTDEAIRRVLGATGWIDDRSCSIDDTWSALRFVKRPTTLRPKDAAKAKAKRGR